MTTLPYTEGQLIYLTEITDMDRLIAHLTERVQQAPGAPEKGGFVWFFQQSADEDIPSLAVGIRDHRGALAWYDEENEFVPINGTNSTHADYFTWDAHHFSFPPSCEVPIELVHEAVREYVRTGARPACVEWRLDES